MKIIEHSIPSPRSRPYILTFGPDGALWFCNKGAGEIGRMDIARGTFRAFALIPTFGGGARAIVGALDGRLFFGQYDIGRIGEVRP